MKTVLIVLAIVFLGCEDSHVAKAPVGTNSSEAYRINVYCDIETGVEYLLNTAYRSGGLTPRYNLDGSLRECK